MYKVLIAEDELLVRMGLKHSIDWAKFDMAVVADKADGPSAYDAFLELQPNLLITDIRMPGMNGLELIRRIRELDNSCVILMLTCLEELSLAREAIQLGVSSYLLKASMTDEDIAAALTHAKSLMDSRTRLHTIINDPKNMTTLQEETVRNYMIRNVMPDPKFNEKATGLGISFLLKPVCVILMEADKYDNNGQAMNGMEDYAIIQSVMDISREKLLAQCDLFILQADGRHIVMLLQEEGNDVAALKAALESIRMALGSYFGLSVTFAIQFAGQGSCSIPNQYAQCRKLMSLKYIFGNGQTILETEAAQFHERLAAQVQLLISSLRDYVGGGTQELDTSMDLFTHDIFNRDIVSDYNSVIICVKEKLLELARVLLKFMKNRPIEESTAFIRTIMDCETFSDATGALVSYINTNCEVNQLPRRDDIKRAILIINREYASQLTMQDVASRVGLSANYFSSLFKQETGENFVAYLNAIRINKVKELLASTQLYFYQIAEETGFTDETYLSRLFKRETGLNPSEWRRNNYEKEN